jgi:Icc protein
VNAVRLLHVTDTHITAGEPGGVATPLADAVHALSGRTTSEALERVLTAVSDVGFTPDLMLHTGDVVDSPDPKSYEDAARLLRLVAAPAIVAPGNHDDPGMLTAIFGPSRMTEVGGWLIIALDSCQSGVGHGSITDDTLTWLEESLSSTGAYVLIGLHHPPLSTCGHRYCRLENSFDLLSVLDRHSAVRGVLSGHLHLADEVERGQVRYLLTPSTCIQLRHHHPLPENNQAARAVGARLLHLHTDGRLESEIVWASLD